MVVLFVVVNVVNYQLELALSSVVINLHCCREYIRPKVKVPRDDVDAKYGNYAII